MHGMTAGVMEIAMVVLMCETYGMIAGVMEIVMVVLMCETYWMIAGVMEIAMVVCVFFYELVAMLPLLILIITSKNDTAVVELMFG